MDTILATFEHLNFWDSIWLFLFALVLHVFEEWNNLACWFEENFISSSSITNKSTRIGVIFSIGFVFVWSTVAVMTRNPNWAALILLPVLALLFMHALQHFYWCLYFRKYAPGVITSILFLLPTTCYLAVKSVQQKYAPTWYVVILIILIAVGLIETINAGKTAPKTVRALNNIGTSLSKIF